MSAIVTASILYDLVNCPTRVHMDAFGDPMKRDPISPFVRMLWEKGSSFEHELMAGLDIGFLDLTNLKTTEKEAETLAAMRRGEPLIYGGRISADDLLGEPDLLRKEGTGYVPGDVKAGSGEEGGDDEERRPKLHYAVQLAVYVDVLERLGLSAAKRGFIWDVHGEEVTYDFTLPAGAKTPETLWDKYQANLAEARRILSREIEPAGAYGATCKLCHWYSCCLDTLSKKDDLTLIPTLGRSKRDVLQSSFGTIAELAQADPDRFLAPKNKTIFRGIGPDTLRTLAARAKLLKTPNAKPYLKTPVKLPSLRREIFFDIEVDPMRDVCYLHGFIERFDGDNDTEKFIAFFAEDANADEEKDAYRRAWDYIRACKPAAVFYYSKYERTIYRKLQKKYPDVCTEDEVETFFDPDRSPTIDLYFDVVFRSTEWPTRDYSIKTLAKYLGFKWRDTNPSGAASIEWFDQWTRTRDPDVRQRILDYNEDDCRATRVLLDGLRTLHSPLLQEVSYT